MPFPTPFQDRTARSAFRSLLLATVLTASLGLGACSKVNDITGSIGNALFDRDSEG